MEGKEIVKGYQKADRPQEAGALADVPRTKSQQQYMHFSRPEGGGLCIRGRNSYQQTSDPARVECPKCLKLMEEQGIKS